MGPRRIRHRFSPGSHAAWGALTALATALLLAAAGCGGSTPTTVPSPTAASSTATSVADQATAAAFPVTVTDDTGREVVIAHEPARIVFTAPSCTEILYALGVGPRVVGVTTVDNYPPEVKDVPKIGTFAKPSVEAITAADPDLVVAVMRGKEALEPLVDAGKTVVVLNPDSLAGVYRDIEMVGAAVGATAQAQQTRDRLAAGIKSLADGAKAAPTTPKVFFALDPTLTTAGPGLFLDGSSPWRTPPTSRPTGRASTTRTPPSSWPPPTPTTSCSQAPCG